MRLPRKHRMIGIEFWGAPVDRLAFDREFLEGPAGGLGHQPCGKDRQSGDGADHHESFHCSLLARSWPASMRASIIVRGCGIETQEMAETLQLVVQRATEGAIARRMRRDVAD